MEHFLTGLWLALGACVGMVAWSFIAWALTHVKVVLLAVLARLGIISPVSFTNGRGERVAPNDPKKGGGR